MRYFVSHWVLVPFILMADLLIMLPSSVRAAVAAAAVAEVS